MIYDLGSFINVSIIRGHFTMHGVSLSGIAFLLVYVTVTERARVAAEWQQASRLLGLPIF